MISPNNINMPGITIAGKHTWRDYKLFMEGEPEIGMPETQSIMLPIPGRDGLLRLTQARDGIVHYNNRSFSASFSPNDRTTFKQTCSVIAGLLHGNSIQMTVDSEPDYIYTGEFSVEPNYAACTLTINASLEPFKKHRTSGNLTL